MVISVHQEVQKVKLFNIKQNYTDIYSQVLIILDV
jgi:hypothetical protein